MIFFILWLCETHFITYECFKKTVFGALSTAATTTLLRMGKRALNKTHTRLLGGGGCLTVAVKWWWILACFLMLSCVVLMAERWCTISTRRCWYESIRNLPFQLWLLYISAVLSYYGRLSFQAKIPTPSLLNANSSHITVILKSSWVFKSPLTWKGKILYMFV